MATADRVLVIAAEAREFAGLLERIPTEPATWPGAAFARSSGNKVLLANGPGPRCIQALLRERPGDIAALISVGFCGALDPALKLGDVVTDGIWSEDKVAVSSADKRRLREQTGARVVEMEYAAVAAKAKEWSIPCRAVKVVSDTAQEDLPLDLNRYRDVEGRFQLARIAMAGIMRPFTVLPRLIELSRNSRLAADKLGAFLANSEF